MKTRSHVAVPYGPDADDLPLARAMRVLVVLVAIACGACAGRHTQTADTLARAGDWETALIQYRLAAQDRPHDLAIRKKIAQAETKVITIWTKRGNQANRDGQLGEAGSWWSKSIELEGEDAPNGKAWAAIRENATALEYFGDVAAAESRHEDAIGVFGALLAVHPDRVELVEKHLESKRGFAAQLYDEANGLAKRNLPGAALVADLRALQHDPLQPKAFSAGTELRRALRDRSRVNVVFPKVKDDGYKGLAAALSRRLQPRLDDFAPYGPTRVASASKATFRVTVEEFTSDEIISEGVEEVPNQEPRSTIPIRNPAIEAQHEVIAGLEKELAARKKKLAASVKKAAKQKRSGVNGAGPGAHDDGLALARSMDETRASLEQAKATLAALPEKVLPPPPPPTWSLPWKETTRIVEARVRFEVEEPDFAQPISMVMTHRVQRADRAHDGNQRHGMPADPLELPGYEDLVAELAARFGQGADAIGQARERRVERLIERGREQYHAGNDAEALDAFVSVLFMMGPSALPEDAAAFVTQSLEHDRFKEIVASN